MALATQYEFTQSEARHVVELNGQLLVGVSYRVADNTITLPARGSVSIPVRTLIVANTTIEIFCAKVLDSYRPSTDKTAETEFEVEHEEGRFEVKLKVGKDMLSDFTVSTNGTVTAAPRSVGPIPFPEFYWALKTVTRIARYIEACVDRDARRQLEFA